MELVVLTQNNCQPCKMVKQYLANNDAEYKEINIQEDSAAIEKYNIMSTPVTLLLDEEEEVVRVNGFKPNELDDLIEQL